MEFSKWNKRITAWVLILTGLYMFLFGDYETLNCVIVLGSGLTAIGLSIWHNINVKK